MIGHLQLLKLDSNQLMVFYYGDHLMGMDWNGLTLNAEERLKSLKVSFSLKVVYFIVHF